MRRGVTLIEVVVVGGLMVVIFGTLFFMLGTSTRQARMAEKKQSAHQSAHRFLVALRRDLRSASKFEPSTASLMLNLASLDENGMPRLEPVSYRWSGNTISRMTETLKQIYKFQPREEGEVSVTIERAGKKSAICKLVATSEEGDELVNLQERIILEGIR